MADSEPVTDQQRARDREPEGRAVADGAGRVADDDGSGDTAVGGNGAAAAVADEPQHRGLGILRETAIIVISALVLSWLIKTFLVQAFFIPSESMRETLEIGDRVMVSRLVPDTFDVHRGDIVVFKDPGGWLPPSEPPNRTPLGDAVVSGLTFVGLLPEDRGEHLIKRVIGLPGDQVQCCDAEGRVTVNGVAVDEELYIAPGSVPSEEPFDRTVPDDMLFVMGDNRQNSDDSRFNTGNPGGGYVPMSNVVGTAFATVWPFPDARIHRNPGSVFQEVPEP